MKNLRLPLITLAFFSLQISSLTAQADTSMSWAYTATLSPIQITPHTNEAAYAEATIGNSGGTLTLKAPDGNVYLLTIPAKAVRVPTLISMTAIDSLANLPIQTKSPAFGVQLSPDGLQLDKPATLKITPTQDIPIREQVFMSYHGTGQELSIPPVLKTQEIQLELEHFSGYVAARGYDQDLTAIRDRLGGSTEELIKSALAVKLARERQISLGGLDPSEDLYTDIPQLTDEFIQKVIKPRVAAAAASCGEGLLALKTIASFSRKLQLLGVDSSGIDVYFAKIDIAKNDEQCMQEEYTNCHDHHVLHRIRDLWLSHEARREDNGIMNSPIWDTEGQLVEKCLNFQIELQSQGVMTDSFSSSVSGSDIFFSYNYKIMHYESKGVLTNTAFKLFNDDPDCTVTTTLGDVTNFMGVDLVFHASSLKDYVDDMDLYYVPGQSKEKYSIRCKNGTSLDSNPAFSAWSSIFNNYHVKTDFAMKPQPGFRFSHWQINPSSELAGEKSWKNKDQDGSESGLVRLYHRPK